MPESGTLGHSTHLTGPFISRPRGYLLGFSVPLRRTALHAYTPRIVRDQRGFLPWPAAAGPAEAVPDAILLPITLEQPWSAIYRGVLAEIGEGERQGLSRLGLQYASSCRLHPADDMGGYDSCLLSMAPAACLHRGPLRTIEEGGWRTSSTDLFGCRDIQIVTAGSSSA